MQPQNRLNPITNFNLLDDLVIPTEDKPKEEVDVNAERFIIHSKIIDTFSVKRTRIRVTPAVCLKCGLDLVQLAFDQNKVETNVFEDLPFEVQAIMRQVLQKHMQTAHSAADELIVTQTSKRWLSGRS